MKILHYVDGENGITDNSAISLDQKYWYVGFSSRESPVYRKFKKKKKNLNKILKLEYNKKYK